ncbi:MAG: hypothetical protein M1816_006206 [Peltula sp. TS41687]|nr:MAG: hypothetical protein M1816_006206 [Peltula sp. TS41687]
MTDAISIEEINRIRIAYGQKPLPVPGSASNGPIFKASEEEEEDKGSTLESRQGAAYDNWKTLQDEAATKTARQAKNEAIKKARDAAKRFTKLEGKGLGDALDGDEEDQDTRTWLMKQKKRQKKVEKARQLEKELAEREQAAVEYTAKDLAGVKVGHEIDEFEAGDEQVLVLKDTTIEENEEEGDELENLELREKEKLSEKLELKKKKPVYDPNQIEETGDNSILGQYDEEIEGKKKKRFTLDGQGLTTGAREAMKEEASERLKARPISLDAPRIETTSDYLELSEVKIRKPKKRKVKSTRQKAIDEDEIFPSNDPSADQNGDLMQLDSVDTVFPAKKRAPEETFVDDEDLQASLAIQRRNALKKRKKVRPEDLARQIREETSATPAVDGVNRDIQGDEEVGLIIDETTEFVANIQKPSIPEKRHHQTLKPSDDATSRAESPDADGDGDVEMTHSHDDRSPSAEIQNKAKRETSGPPAVTSTGLDEEITLNAGIGSTVTMLSQRGLLERSAAAGDLNALHRERQRFLAEKQRRESEAERRARLQRERDRASGKLDRMSAREKEAYAQAENKQRDQYESRQMADIFNREYRPDIEIKYTDEFGRQLNQKEAFKHLSHQFHGKGSGKQKTEKRLKKIEEEKRREAKSVLDGGSETGMGNAMGMVSKTSKVPGIRLQ